MEVKDRLDKFVSGSQHLLSTVRESLGVHRAAEHGHCMRFQVTSVGGKI